MRHEGRWGRGEEERKTRLEGRDGRDRGSQTSTCFGEKTLHCCPSGILLL